MDKANIEIQDAAICDECETICDKSAILTAPNPFDPEDQISGCPNCKSPGSMVTVCDYKGCNRRASSGFPAEGGYRQTCYEHGKCFLKSTT